MTTDKLRNVSNTVCITCLMIDSGGGLGIRNLSFLIIFFSAFYSFYKEPHFNSTFWWLYVVFMISLIPGIMISYSSHIEIPKILVWIVSFLLVPILYGYIRGSKLVTRSFVVSGTIFALLIISLFVGRILNIGPVNVINDYITLHSDGFFGDKSFLSGDILPNVYFQGTLALVICGVFCLESKSSISYGLILLALILAPSRFGFLVLSCWGIYVYISKSYLRLGLIPILVLVAYLVLLNFPFGVELMGIFNGKSDGFEIRNGHLSSIYQDMSNNYLSFLFGEGPGSFFYSKGVGEYIDNIEISQLEYLRKYGIISFIMFSIFYFWPLMGRKKNIYIKGGLIMFYILAFSNPVLYSIFSMLFLSFAYYKIFAEDDHISRVSQENLII